MEEKNNEFQKSSDINEFNVNIDKQNNKKTMAFNFVLIAIIFIALTIYMISVDGIDNIVNVLTHVNYSWVIAGFVCLLIQWLSESYALHLPIKRMYPNQKFSNSFKVNMIGQLFNNLTPFSTGGQPMQAYELNKTGKCVSDSLSAMAIKFVVAQSSLLLFSFLLFRSSLSNSFICLQSDSSIGISCLIILIINPSFL